MEGEFTGFSKGVLSKVLPAYLLSAGLGSKVSRWLYPPERKIQTTDRARAGECAALSKGVAPRPSSANMAPRAIPVQPRPISARKVLREECVEGKGLIILPDGLEIVVIEKGSDQSWPGNVPWLAKKKFRAFFNLQGGGRAGQDP